ncbi:helix-turn-helix domain-containing protein [Streptomyces sp. KS_5]|uniref:winged helix-turn-helix transcriptional regulator n=1 Tax=Streptomyces sp. KS_5 TaxID=1881018 RepID=UPI000894AF46|nr:helix-turn-helix domain-containing protein [Streptomyces sp. KS_5]SEE36411.1 transcriptional regulator, HxlR family [Streptomyces sp. KS_5]
MARKDFGQYCGLARALELVGERWALLIIRELLTHPSRYTDLLEDLPGIPTNVLSTRLKELEQVGIVERQVAPAPQRGVLYALTEDGQSLQSAVLTLALWGNSRLGEQQASEFVPPSSVAMAFRATFNAQAAEGLSASWEIHTAGVMLYVVITKGQLTTGIGPASPDPDLVITIRSAQMPTFQAVLKAIASGKVETNGREELLGALIEIFAPAELLASLGR